MEYFEYSQMREKGREYFNSIDHNTALSKIMVQSMDSILNFSANSSENIKEYQLKKISQLVDYAYLNIPLYKKKYDEVGYKVGSIKSFSDFEKLPFLYKEELIENFPHGIVKDLNSFMLSTRSSGSSGKFVTLAVNLDAIYQDTLQGIRQFIKQSNGIYKKEDNVLFIYTCPWWIENISGEYRQSFLPTTCKFEDAIETIKQVKPVIISTYPTYLQGLCQYDIDLGKFGVKLVIVHSEQSSEQMRNEMSKKLNVEVLDEYSSEELTRIALECPHKNYHLEEDACYIEIVDSKTKKKVADGTSGVVVGTNLLNNATPIIRYWQGDIASLATEKNCACGSNFRILDHIQGRQMDCIISNKNIIPASSFMDLAYNWYLEFKIPIHGMTYQIIQTELKNIDILLQKGLFRLSNDDIEKIKQSMYMLIDKSINVTVKFTDNFVYTSNKFKPVISLINRGENG